MDNVYVLNMQDKLKVTHAFLLDVKELMTPGEVPKEWKSIVSIE